MQVCPQCQSDRLDNNGSAAGKPKKLCRQCGCQFTRITPRGKPLAQSKAMTHEIERHHGRQRHWFGRFKRKSIIVSKSKEMVDLTMALFAKFWGNGNQDELLSLLG
jgi:insertion element IS1 protein InsB